MGVKLLLEKANVPGIRTYEVYRREGGYAAAEKALKALLVAAGVTPPYSHSLERLVELLQQEGFSLDALQELHLKPLTRMNSETRYPKGDEAPADLYDQRDSDLALTTAEAEVLIASTELTC